MVRTGMVWHVTRTLRSRYLEWRRKGRSSGKRVRALVVTGHLVTWSHQKGIGHLLVTLGM